MKASQNCIDLIKRFEGCRLVSYKALPHEKYYTIGYGHYSPAVREGMVITQQQAEAFLKSDIIKFEDYVNFLYLSLTQNQFDALVSFTYNCGAGNLRQLTKNRTITEIGNALLLYNKANGKVYSGLTKRRQAERALFFKGYSTSASNDLTDIAREVIAGKWGNGANRKDSLTRAGYDYKAVQREVNRLMGK